MEGDPLELKWNRKDLGSLIEVLKLVPGRDAVVQAGGCLGVFAKHLAREFDVVYTFEPSPELFPALVRNVPEPNVVRIQAALGERHALVGTICSLRPNDGKTTLHPGMTRVEGPGPIPTLTIDDLELPVCDLIYLDVEGHELYAIRGAVATIQRCRPVVACEVNRGMEYLGLRPEQLRAQMRLMGYVPAGQHRSDEVFAPREHTLAHAG